MRTLILATGNAGKLEEFRHFWQSLPADSQWELQLKPPELDIPETGITFAENASQKARGVALATGEWALADDSGLAVSALGGAPGVYSARYAPTDSARIARLLNELATVEAQTGSGLGSLPDRSAEFVCAIALCDPQGEIQALAQGSCQGLIIDQPRGQAGFGYDPVFLVPELGLTFAEMTKAQKQTISHRGLALQALRSQLLALS